MYLSARLELIWVEVEPVAVPEFVSGVGQVLVVLRERHEADLFFVRLLPRRLDGAEQQLHHPRSVPEAFLCLTIRQPKQIDENDHAHPACESASSPPGHCLVTKKRQWL